MSRSSQAGFIAFGPQFAKGSTPITFYKYRAADIDFGAVEPGGLLPPEIASVMVPTGAYKLGAFAGGGMTFIPRLEDDLGWLLQAIMGEVSSTTALGVTTHTFKYPTIQSTAKWLQIRKWIPASVAQGEKAADCQIARLQLTLPQAGPVTARIDAVGRTPTFLENPTWTFATIDSGGSFPVVGTANSWLKLPTFQTAAVVSTGAVIEFVNLLTTPQQEFIIGSQYPDDFAILQRAATIRWVYKWESPDLSRIIMTGAKTGVTAWTPQVYTSDFEAQVEGTDPLAIGATANKQAYRLTVNAARVSWEPNGPIRLMGNNILAQEYIGTVLEPTSGEYCTIKLQNAKAGYTWPSS